MRVRVSVATISLGKVVDAVRFELIIALRYGEGRGRCEAAG